MLDRAPDHERTGPGGRVVAHRLLSPLARELLRPRIGPLALCFLLVVCGRGAAMALPVAMPFLIDTIIGERRFALLLPLIAVLLVSAVVQAVCNGVAVAVMSRQATDAVAQLRRRTQEHVGRLPLRFYDAHQSGALARQIIEDTSGVRHLFGMPVIQAAGAVGVGLFSLILMLRLSPTLTGAAVLAIAPFGVMSAVGIRRLRPLLSQMMATLGQATGRLTEAIAGIRYIKGYGVEAAAADAFSRTVQRIRDESLRLMLFRAWLGAVGPLRTGVLLAAVVYMGVGEIRAEVLTLGMFVSFIALLTRLTSPVIQLSVVSHSLAEAAASLSRVQQLLDEVPEDRNARRVHVLKPIDGHIAFENVSFGYAGSSEPDVLSNVTFDALPGTSMAFVGPSGSGKSTLFGLLAAFYEPSDGRIRVDGVDLSTVRLDSYRTQLGLVLQDNLLFDGTVKANVTLARPHAPEAAIRAACRLAHVEEFAERLPQGYETIVGERGVRLSLGQRQRISIARALLANPRVLILDEATSNLDSESEAVIRDGLRHLMKDRTTFIIAHRLSTIQFVDQILVLDDGRIRERGTHESLRLAGGRYSELLTAQLAGTMATAPREPLARKADGHWPDLLRSF